MVENPAKGHFSASVVEYMEDGVMVLNSKGSIIVFNPAAERILGQTCDDVLGQSLATCFIHDEANDEFNNVILTAIMEKNSLHNASLEYVRPDGKSVTLDVKSSFFSIDTFGVETSGVIIVFNDVTYLKQLEKEQQSLNQELADSYRKLEESNQRLLASQKRKRLLFIFSAVFLFLVILPVGYLLYAVHDKNAPNIGQSALESVLPLPSGQQAAQMKKIKPTKETVVSEVTLGGRLEPLNIVNMVCPFDSQIADKMYGYGQLVKREDSLLRLATDQIETQLREAETALIKAQQEYEKYINWETDTEMNQAKRQLQRSKMTLDSTRSKLDETKLLLDKGLVQRSEYDSLREQHQNQLLELKNSEESFASVQKKGGKEYVAIAKKALENAQAKADELSARISQYIIKAPVDGIVIKPIASRSEKETTGAALEKGVNVTKGAILLAIGNLDGLSVRSKVDEMEITKVRPGLKAKVRGDAFPGLALNGELSDIAAQAGGDAMGPPQFDVLVTVKSIPPEIARKIRVGMTAQVSITVYERPDAVTLPISAVRRGAEGRYVLVYNTATGKPESKPVQTGLTTMGAVEILSGLTGEEDVLVD
jgi:PAS domain S-box-containing protein